MYTVWVGAVPGGGQRLNSGQTWSLSVPPGTKRSRIWPRTNCSFDSYGRGKCQTGDCNGLLRCQDYGSRLNTLVEYTLNQFNNTDYFDISIVEEYSVPMEFKSNSDGSSNTNYSYTKDGQTSTFTCPGGTNYNVVFCPFNEFVFTIQNNCPYTVWAGAVPGGGRQLNSGQTWYLAVAPGTTGGRIWPRTGCKFDGSGRGRCQTGDCNGLLQCQNYGTPPNTLAEYALNQFNNLDFFDISLVDGFNVPMSFRPNSGGCTRGISCTADINGQCPSQLRAPGGCNNPCTVFKTDEYCCDSGSCGPTDFSRYFKTRCPDAYSYPKDDQTSTFTCPGGTSYDVVFCPLSNLITESN